MPLFWRGWGVLLLCVALGLLYPAFAVEPSPRLRVAVSTTLIADVVRQVAGDRVELRVLLPPNVDAHSFEPAPQDLVAALEADLLLVNGFNLEAEFLTVLQNAGEAVRPISISEGITPRTFGAGEVPEVEQGVVDPHVWLDPANVQVWVDNLVQHLSKADPAHADSYQANATAYADQLAQLDTWIAAQVEKIPAQQRRLVTDHDVFGYYAQRYGFALIGALFPGISTLAEPSAAQLAELEKAIQSFGIKAIFVGTTVNPTLAEQVAKDTGIRLVFVYTGSLSDADGPAATYLDYMRYNTDAIVEALR